MEPDMDQVTASCGVLLVASLAVVTLLVILVVVGLLT